MFVKVFILAITRSVTVDQMWFERVRLTGTRLPDARVLDARFNTCDLSEADWEKAHQTHVEVRESRLLGFKAVEARLQDMTVVGCDASFALFFGAILVATRFAGRIVTEASFQEADLTGVVFDRCGLGAADVRGATLAGADLRGARGRAAGRGDEPAGGSSWTRHKP